MHWPKEILSAFATALKIDPAEGLDTKQVLQILLDETARRAIWRAQGDPAKLGNALRSPYTPLGALTASCVDGRAKSLTLQGPSWCTAVDALYEYMDAHAPEVCATFEDEWEPYADGF